MKTNRKLNFTIGLITLFLLQSTFAFTQGWVNTYSPDRQLRIQSIHQKSDSTYWVSGSNLLTNDKTRLMQIDQDGTPLAAFDFDSITMTNASSITPDEGYIFLGNGIFDTLTPRIRRHAILRADSDGNKLWRKDFNEYYLPTNVQSTIGNHAIDTTNDNGFIGGINPYDTILNQNIILLKRLDENGNILWENTYYDTVPSAFVTNIRNAGDGGFIIHVNGFHTVEDYRTKIFKINENGDFLWEYIPTFQTNWLHSFISYDNNIIIQGSDSTYLPYIGKVNQSGDEIWLESYPYLPDSMSMSGIIEVDPETYASFSYNYSEPSQGKRVGFVKTDTSGNILHFNYLPTSNVGYDLSLLPGIIIHTMDGGFLHGGWISHNEEHKPHGYLIKMDSEGQVFPNTVSGIAFNDKNQDCERTPDEELLAGKIITFKNQTDTFHVMTSDSGHYALGLDTGVHTIEIEPISPYWEQVGCNLSEINLQSGNDTTISFGFEAVIELPYLKMDAYTRHRVCMPGTYALQYCNTGTAPFSGIIEIEFDSILQIDSASIPWISVSDNVYTFPETDGVGLGKCKTLEVYYTVPCEMDLTGRTLCINAHAYSDTIASTSALWDESNLVMRVDYNSSTDSVAFRLTNTGTGNMTAPKDLIVIEDNVILMKNAVQLLAGEELIEKKPANGSTWRAFIEQTDHNPYSAFTTAAIEGAGVNQQGEVSLGYINQFPVNGYYAFNYTYCDIVRNSFDPNQKTVKPQGLLPDHIINANIDLEYLIEFQNTGNDLAYVVRIVDTLPPYVNPQTIVPGISSHPYEFNFISHNVIEFLFEGINLPDSTSNEPESHGFVKFRIKQYPNNEIGTVIDNRVGIYFDYNDPVITDIARVKIGEFVFSNVSVMDNLRDQVTIHAYPNPFSETANIELTGYQFNELTLHVYDMNGRLVHQQHQMNSGKFKIHRDDLSPGTHFFEIRNEGVKVGSGKIIFTD